MSTLDEPTPTPLSDEVEKPGILVSALGGLASAGFGLGVAEIVASASRSLKSPVIVVGDRVVDLVPSALKNIAIDLFGTNDKIALLVGIAATLALYAALLGVVGLRKSIRLAMVGVALFGLIGAISAALDRAGTDVFAALPSVIGGFVTAAALIALYRLSKASLGELAATPVESGSGRRGFLTTLGVLGIGGVVTAVLGRSLASRFNVSTADLGALPTPLETLAPVPASAQGENAASFTTPNDDFYQIDISLTSPQVDVDSWSMRIHGMVDNEITLTYEDLLARDMIEQDITLTCVSNTIGGELVGTARWLGTRLDDLLNEAGIDPNATQIVGRSVDGYTCGFPVSALDGRDALVAVGMNGEALPTNHGFPARLIVPGLYGYVSATKWLSDIELTTFEAFDHYWVSRGYSVEAPIKMQSRIDAPRGLDRIPAGPFVIGGVAWAQTIGIDAVEVSIDDGEWIEATLADEVNDITWRQWSLPWDATPGRHSVTVRAKDRNGSIQTDERTEPLPNGAAGHHTIVVLVDEA